MSTRKVIFVSILSSLITMVAMFAILVSINVTLVQGRELPTGSLSDLASAAPTAVPENSSLAVTDDNIDPNSSAGLGATGPEDGGAASAAAATVYQHVAGSVFTPLFSDAGVVYTPNGCVYSTGPHLSLNFPLILPPGSTITSLRLYFNDTNPTVAGRIHLAQYDDGNSNSYLTTVYTPTGSAGLSYTTVTGLNIVPDYVNYNYNIYWLPGASDNSVQLCGYRVGYIPPSIFGSALPLIQK